MKEQRILFETAKLAKEKGFNEYTLSHYDMAEDIFQDDANNDQVEIFEYSAPTQSLLQKWLREEHKLHVNNLIHSGVGKYGVELIKYTAYDGTDNGKHVGFGFKQCFTYSYEEALEEGLKEALKQIESK